MEPEFEIARIKNMLHEMRFRMDEISSDLAMFSKNLAKITEKLSGVQMDFVIQKEMSIGDEDE
jgi:hypothetical protein